MFKKKYEKYMNKIGGFVNSSCLPIKDEEIEKNLYNYVFNNEKECIDFYEEINKMCLTKYTMNKEEKLEKLTLENLMIIAEYPDYWKLYLKNKTKEYKFYRLIHYACQKFTSSNYSQFWEKMAIYHDLWEMQLPDASGKTYAGQTPLHIAAFNLVSPEYSEFWEKMLNYHDLWKIQMSDASGEKYAGKTPLHTATYNLTLPQYSKFWEKLTEKEYIDLWKIQMTYASGKEYVGITPLYNATFNLTSPKYLEFWNKIAEYHDLWNIQMSNSKDKEDERETPLYLVAHYLTSPEYLPFFEKISKYIEKNNNNNSSLAFSINSEIFEKIFGKIDKNIYDIDYYISAHGSLTGSFFKLYNNITVIFMAKSYTPAYASITSKYISSRQNDLNTTLNMCDKLNILRIYEKNDLVPNLNFDFFDISPPYKLRGILNKENYDKTLREYFELTIDINYDHPTFFNEKRNIIDDLGIFKSEHYKKKIKSNLHDIIKYISNKHKNKNITLVVGSCRVSYDYDYNFHYDKLCKYIQLIDRTKMPITRYDKLCNDKTKIISKNKTMIEREMSLNLEREYTFATPEDIGEKEEIFNNFDKDIDYACNIGNDEKIKEINRKLISHEQISFVDIIDVYKYIINNQEVNSFEEISFEDMIGMF
jgi:hypothetical protein